MFAVLCVFLLAQADVIDIAGKLSSSSCSLPTHQLQLIEEYRSLVRGWQSSRQAGG